MDFESISNYMEGHVVELFAAFIVLLFIGSTALFIRMGRNGKGTRSPRSMKDKVTLVLKQAGVALPQAADYPGMLGKEGSKLINEIQNHLAYIRACADLSSGTQVCSKTTSEMNTVEFQHTLVDCQKKLKQFSLMLVDASKKASDINLPKAFKEKRTIKSLGDVGLIENEDGI